jgi:hypothetical protein
MKTVVMMLETRFSACYGLALGREGSCFARRDRTI